MGCKTIASNCYDYGYGVVCVFMMDGLHFALDLEPGAYFGGDGQLGASRLKILIYIYVFEKNLDLNLG